MSTKAATAALIGQPYRVVYKNVLDGAERVFLGCLTMAEANAVMAKWGNPKERFFYMGPGMRIEPCDGTPNGALIAGAAA